MLDNVLVNLLANLYENVLDNVSDNKLENVWLMYWTMYSPQKRHGFKTRNRRKVIAFDLNRTLLHVKSMMCIREVEITKKRAAGRV